MANSLKTPHQVSDDEWLLPEPEVEADAYPDETDELPMADEATVFTDELPTVTPADTLDELLAADDTDSAALCPICGDLLAWHEQPCLSASTTPLVAAPLEPSEQELVVQLRPSATTFAYELGHRVQPTPANPAEVIWRGQLKERHPTTGLIHRVNVYRLNDGYWDCYREEELQVA